MAGPWVIGANGPGLQDGKPGLISQEQFEEFEECCCDKWACVRVDLVRPEGCTAGSDQFYHCSQCRDGLLIGGQWWDDPAQGGADYILCEVSASAGPYESVMPCGPGFDPTEITQTVISVHSSLAACEAVCGEEWV